MKMKTFRLSDETADALGRLAAARFTGNETAAVTAAVTAMAEPPALSVDIWQTLRANAKRRLRRSITEPEMGACLDVTQSWWVTGADAALIDQEIEDALEDGVAVRQGCDGPALVAKLQAMSDLDRAVLTLACREWWDGPEPRPALAQILGGQLRGPRSN